MDVIWLKRDLRLTDHGPLAAVAQRKDRDVCILYLYEPDQLAEPSVHGSHVLFANEGLVDLDTKLSNLRRLSSGQNAAASKSFGSLTVCHCEAIQALQAIHGQKKIARLLAHMETGHMRSYARDKRVRKWCRDRKIPFVELPQTGVSRCLTNRDDFHRNLQMFLKKKQYRTPTALECNIVIDLELPGRSMEPLFAELIEIPLEQRVDRTERQQGGETTALEILRSFLYHRGVGFSKGISSPNSSWTSCSRLSPYLTWGQISLRHVVQALQERQAQLKTQKCRSDDRWLRSFTAFSSRVHWRSHFIQKLESEPEMEQRDVNAAFQPLRRQPGDWNECYYQAWSTGKTGYPMMDACMRCLHRHGWVNFRMRAMLVSFASYNLWLDWHRFAPHLARVFLDYEPGIHYPQIQMQSGTTGINALRCYSVTKQGKEHDPRGIFVRKYIPELQSVPNDYIHEPWKMSKSMQAKCGVHIGEHYPAPIVNEQKTAKIAKERIAAVRRRNETQEASRKVYEKHGSRVFRTDNPVTKKKIKIDPSQTTLPMHATKMVSNNANVFQALPIQSDLRLPKVSQKAAKPVQYSTIDSFFTRGLRTLSSVSPSHHKDNQDRLKDWECPACTFRNEKPLALACTICGTTRSTNKH
jgi:deoxyribodipyrimidine photo-lyase